MTINDLVTLVPPPALPIENGPPEKWGTIEASLGTAMPPDYREFGLRYGSGRFCKGFIEVFNPFAESYSELVKVQCNFLRTVKDAGMELPHDPFPALPGLLPWGRDENGHMMCWLTDGKPDEWPIILRRHENRYETWGLPLTSFLAQVFRNELNSILWQEPFREEELTFVPAARPKPNKKKRRK